ncbi:MAG: sulfatase family protein, partial [Puniceicoccales bacterium]
HMITPNLDRLAGDGCLFTNAYSPNPICVPARHYLLTGNPASQHGYYDNSGHEIKDHGLPTLARTFSENGYYTAAIGKCHFHPPKAHHGYCETHLMEEIPAHISEDAYLQFLRDQGHGECRNIHGIRGAIYHEPQAALLPEEMLGPNWVAQRAVDWIGQNADRPFLLTCGWIKPHPPWNLPETKRVLYADRELPEPIVRSRVPPFPTGDNRFYGDEDSDETKREIREAYFTTITMVDEAVGQILSCLETKGILDDTIIIFTSDHGEMLQDKGYYQKMLPFESSARIPMMIRYPEAFSPGSRSDELTDLMDIFPTCLELAGIDYFYNEKHRHYGLSGGSLVPGSHSPWQRDREVQFCDCLQGPFRWVSLRDRRYKFVHFFAGGQEYLYDLENDPGELNNLIGQREPYDEIHQRLRSQAIRFETERGPGDTVHNGDFSDCGRFSYNEFDWNNCDKYPRWSYAHFPVLGKGEREAERYLEELTAATRHWPEDRLPAVPMPTEAREALGNGFRKLGGNPQDLLHHYHTPAPFAS